VLASPREINDREITDAAGKLPNADGSTLAAQAATDGSLTPDTPGAN
jgi:hypothetical protein